MTNLRLASASGAYNNQLNLLCKVKSSNSGDSWQRWPADVGADEFVAAFEITPRLEDGGHQVFILTESGQFIVKGAGDE